jgi:hypothetical protein
LKHKHGHGHANAEPGKKDHAHAPQGTGIDRRLRAPEEGGKFAKVFLDATVGLPLVVGAVLERLGKK